MHRIWKRLLEKFEPGNLFAEQTLEARLQAITLDKDEDPGNLKSKIENAMRMCNCKVFDTRKAALIQKAASPHYPETIANLLTRMDPGKSPTVDKLLRDLKLT